MKSFLKFLLILCGVFLLSMLLAPVLFKILPFKFEKIFNRLIMIFSFVAIAVFVRVDRAKLAGYGLCRVPEIPRLILTGFFGGVITLVLLTAVKMIAGVAHWDVEPFSYKWITKPLGVLFAAFLIGLIEEVFFRGFIYKTFHEKFRWNAAAAVTFTSIFYSIIHFVSVKKPYIGPNPGLKESFQLLIAPLASFAQWPDLWRAAVGLFIFGVVLNLLANRTRSLYMSIGLHAGCVFFVKLDSFFVEFVNNNPLLWGSAKMYDSAAGWVFLTLMGFGLTAAASRMLKRQTVSK